MELKDTYDLYHDSFLHSKSVITLLCLQIFNSKYEKIKEEKRRKRKKELEFHKLEKEDVWKKKGKKCLRMLLKKLLKNRLAIFLREKEN